MITAVRSNPIFSATDTSSTTPPKAGGPTTGGTAATAPLGEAKPSDVNRVLPTNKSGMGRDEFLKMLVAQLKNQDPLNPMDGKDMAAQLAQFSAVEQLQQLNTSVTAQKQSQSDMAKAIEALSTSQTQSADNLSQLIEGQMAVSTVGKIGVTPGNTIFVDRDGGGQFVIDTGTVKGPGRVTVLDDQGKQIATANVGNVVAGQQAIDLRDVGFNPPLKQGKYQFKFEVATDGGQWQQVKTYSAGRITGLKYDQGNPILIIGDSLAVPMSKLTQIRG